MLIADSLLQSSFYKIYMYSNYVGSDIMQHNFICMDMENNRQNIVN